MHGREECTGLGTDGKPRKPAEIVTDAGREYGSRSPCHLFQNDDSKAVKGTGPPAC